jgi:hypothetical protein
MTTYCTRKYVSTRVIETLCLELEARDIQVCGVHPIGSNSAFLERSIFRGRSEQEAKPWQQQMQQMIKRIFTSQPEDALRQFGVW